ncbi:DUF2268 domain-containing putative Zn-dependent protease [Bacillus sp. MUM 13]|uniref:DUF2268 domain-containing protein n=1 Tax=Bacillus sp. MUM 13 TaxID=1678001 RepID=UPI0008F5DE0D|nr:DUF2268 domain-containing putative Zn-dependent protease [Bacillus sp. MUM 13]OIK11210.1 hypothetical protein BIV59_12955 [Bacillus sp. MUM 13]
MGIENTNEWLRDDFFNPSAICDHFKDLFMEQDSKKLYQYLKSYGMYSPGQKSRRDAESLMDHDIWGKGKKIFNKYKKKWNGPDVPIFIFPLKQPGFLERSIENKSGLAFPDKMLLFIHAGIKDKELEALFIHEYHHVCRLNKMAGGEEEPNLLDSMIMEGLAENAVAHYLGKEYLAGWTSVHSEEKLEEYWIRYVEKHIHVKRHEKLHDSILLGQGRYPSMLGYCMGYHLVKKQSKIPFMQSFSISAEKFLDNNEP